MIIESKDLKVEEALKQGVQDHAFPYLGAYNERPFSLSIKGPDSKIIAGLCGILFYRCARVNWAWVEEGYRNQGIGSLLFKQLETYANSKDCKTIQLATLDFQARPFYEKLGFECAGTIPGWIEDHDCFFMKKTL